ncbi:MAG: hypothetical protein NC548_42285 [Lachnospiraceae bacterium]|nr:hypothetical protein [Lachnospiraceae bacterium]
MQARLLGVQGIKFTNDKGEEVNGMNIHVAFNDENVEGLKTEKFFLKSSISLPKDTKINDMLEISFNYKGKIEMVQKA